MLPLESDVDMNPFLDHGEVQSWTQLFFDLGLGSKFMLYFKNGWFIRFGDDVSVTSPIRTILNYYPSDKWTLYLPSTLAPQWDGFSWSAHYLEAGLGLKYHLNPNLEVEALYTQFFDGRNQGAGVTYNLGLRILE